MKYHSTLEELLKAYDEFTVENNIQFHETSDDDMRKIFLKSNQLAEQPEEKTCPKCQSNKVIMFTDDMDICEKCRHQWYA